MKLIITPPVKALGIQAAMALVKGATISNKSNPLEKLKKEAVAALQSFDLASSPVLAGYHRLYELTGTQGQGHLPPAEHLIGLAKRNGRLPNINTVVDCYNLVSARTGLSIGAHNTAYIVGDVQFKLTDGSELYTPLGATEPVPVGAGEYACCDDQKIICRLDVKQCDQTKVTKETSEFIVYVQGNPATDFEYVMAGLQQVCDLMAEICGGQAEIITAQD